MRVVTLLPAATEIVAMLGGAQYLVGISHECDYPAAVTGLPRVTATPIDPEAPGAAIDAEVRRIRAEGHPVIAVDAGQLERLAPDLLVTQGLCEVCAVADGEVHRLAAALPSPPRVVSLSATALAGILEDIRTMGRELDLAREAQELVAGLERRLTSLRERRPPRRTRVACLEWLEPLYLAGHWVPELVEAAGGVDVGARPGSPSARQEWGALARLEPEVVVVILCGFGIERARRELAAVTDPAARGLLREHPVWILDGNAYTSRAGPRVVDGAELLRIALEDGDGPNVERWRAPWG